MLHRDRQQSGFGLGLREAGCIRSAPSRSGRQGAAGYRDFLAEGRGLLQDGNHRDDSRNRLQAGLSETVLHRMAQSAQATGYGWVGFGPYGPVEPSAT